MGSPLEPNRLPTRHGSRVRLLALVTDGFGASGGIARYNCDLMTALGRCDDFIEVLALPRFGSAGSALPERVIQIEATANAYRWALRAVGLALDGRTDVIFCGHLNAAPFAARLAKAAGLPLWIQVHGVEAWQDRGPRFRSALQRASLVTSVSRHTRGRLLSWCDLDPQRVRVLPNTFDAGHAPAERRSDLVERYGLDGRKVILTVGRIAAAERYKGHDRVIRCLPQLMGTHPDVSYLIVGTGDDQRRLEELSRDLGVGDEVIFAGHVATAELRDHYALADVFAMPSTGEGFGIVFLEAAASGLPVIGGNRDGSVDALADGALGMPVDPDDLPSLAKALMDALTSSKPSPVSVTERFAFDNFSRQVHELVQKFCH